MNLKVVAISGSLSQTSCNTGLIKACLLVNNPHLSIEVADISDFPLFNMDIILEHGFPPEVERVRNQLAKADGLILAIPEHNFKVSAPMKNAYDWLSFSMNQQNPSPVKHLPVGMMSASLTGGKLAQQHFKRIGQYCELKIMEQSVEVKRFEPGMFDQQGNLINKKTVEQLTTFLSSFGKFVEANKK